jgi:hypothetical protein
VYCLLGICSNIEAADHIVMEVPNNLLLLSAEVADNT